MQLYLGDWAAAMADDCDGAQVSITASALSCLPPLTKTPGQWPRLWQSWQTAAARGIKVQLLLPAPTAIHGATVKNARTADVANRAGIACRLIPGPHLLHCKSVVIDGRILWIGSGNFTSAAAHHNYEAYTRVVDSVLAWQVENRWRHI